MNYSESALTFNCADALGGVLARPEQPTRRGVIVVGGPQYRVGSHRQFLQLARALAAEGVFRFCASTTAAWAIAQETYGPLKQ
jgi:dienelactone hydrolase